jgi:hypothetical protein
MTALSAARLGHAKELGGLKSFLCADSKTFYNGALVMLDSDGKIRPAAALAANRGCVGVVEIPPGRSEAAGTPGYIASGTTADVVLNVREGLFKVVGATLGQDDVGALMWALDDQTVDETAPAASVGQCPAAGYLVEYIGASSGIVEVTWRRPQVLIETLLWAGYIPLDTVVNGDIVTALTPGFAGIVTRLSSTTFIVDSTGGDEVQLNVEIGTTNCTGTLALTSAELAAVGEIVTTALTGGVYFGPSDTISIEAANVTDMVTPTVNVQLYGQKIIKL